ATRDGLPHGDVHGAVRARAHCRLDRTVEGNDRRPAPEAWPPAPALYRRSFARISADVEAEIARPQRRGWPLFLVHLPANTARDTEATYDHASVSSPRPGRSLLSLWLRRPSGGGSGRPDRRDLPLHRYCRQDRNADPLRDRHAFACRSHFLGP